MPFPIRCPARHLVFLSGVTSSLLPMAPLAGQAQPVLEGRYCEAPIVRREVLRNERGDPLYVTPDALLAQDGELLIAGQFSIEFARDESNVLTPSRPNGILAVLRLANGSVRTFPRFSMGALEPIAVRGVALGAGAWGVVVHAAKVDANGEPVGDQTLWFATLTKSGWGAVEQIPLPRGVHAHSQMARHLVVRGGRVVAAMPADSGNVAYGVVLVQRERGRWTSRFYNTGIASYTALALDGATNELALAVVRADTTQETDTNSLFLLYPDRPNDTLRLLVRGGQSPVHHPTMHGTPRGISLAWRVHEGRGRATTRTAVHAIFERGRLLEVTRVLTAPARITTIAGNRALAVVSTRNKTGDSIHLTLHALPAPSEGVRLSYRSTYAEIVGVERWSESEVAIGLVAAAKDGGHLVNEILWVGTRCKSSGRSESATDAASSYRSPHHVQSSHSSSHVTAVRERLR